MAAGHTLPKLTPLSSSSFRKWAWEFTGFRKYGLFHNDLYDEGLIDVQEALRRLPKHIRDERNFRLVRALQLSMLNQKLPAEEWTKYEECIQKRYLDPYIHEVQLEREEKEKWNKTH